LATLQLTIGKRKRKGKTGRVLLRFIEKVKDTETVDRCPWTVDLKITTLLTPLSRPVR